MGASPSIERAQEVRDLRKMTFGPVVRAPILDDSLILPQFEYGAGEASSIEENLPPASERISAGAPVNRLCFFESISASYTSFGLALKKTSCVIVAVSMS